VPNRTSAGSFAQSPVGIDPSLGSPSLLACDARLHRARSGSMELRISMSKIFQESNRSTWPASLNPTIIVFSALPIFAWLLSEFRCGVARDASHVKTFNAPAAIWQPQGSAS
jgi:hypothetical protein